MTKAICIDKMLAAKPKDFSLMDRKSAILDNLYQIRSSLKADARGIPPDATKAQEWLNKGVELGQSGKLDQALKAFDKTIELAPDSIQAWHNKELFWIIWTLRKKPSKAYEKSGELDKNILWIEKTEEGNK